MSGMRVTMATLLIVGFVFFLVGLLAEPAGAVESKAPALQPSPRPTSALPTLEPTTEPPTPEPPPSEPAEPAPQPASPTPTPRPALLPDAGGTLRGGWLLGLGGGFMLLGFVLAVLRPRRA
jgi:hypothetical protein